jgi:uncharacterized protein
MKRARQFHEHGLGCLVEQDHGEFVTLGLGADASALALYQWEAPADDAGVPAAGSGFRGFTLSYIVGSADEVNAVLARVAPSGGEISKPPRRALWGYSAYVTDPSGYLWKIASPKRRPLIARKPPAVPVDEHNEGATSVPTLARYSPRPPLLPLETAGSVLHSERRSPTMSLTK